MSEITKGGEKDLSEVRAARDALGKEVIRPQEIQISIISLNLSAVCRPTSPDPLQGQAAELH